MCVTDDVQLVVRINYFRLPDARETGRILDRLGILAERPVGGAVTQAPFQLAIERVEISSWVAILKPIFDIGAAAMTLIEQREHVREMLHQMIAALESLRQSNGGELPSTMRTFFSEISTPIRRGRATRVEIHLKGDNDCHFIFEEADAVLIQQVVAMVRPSPLREGPVPKRSVVTPVITKSYGGGWRTIGDFNAERRVKDLKKAYPSGTRVYGSLIFYEGAWRFRIDGAKGTTVLAESVPAWLDRNESHPATGSANWIGRPATIVIAVDPIPRSRDR
jgi:hypothetical protein